MATFFFLAFDLKKTVVPDSRNEFLKLISAPLEVPATIKPCPTAICSVGAFVKFIVSPSTIIDAAGLDISPARVAYPPS